MNRVDETPVWITGVGVVSALGNDFHTFAKALRRGEDAAQPITAFETGGLRGRLGCEAHEFVPSVHFERRELRRMDRGSCLLVVAAREAMTMAGLKPGDYDPVRSGIALGTTLGGMIEATNYYDHLKRSGNAYVTKLTDYPLYMPAVRVCREYGIVGPNVAISTACSSANIAIGIGADMIRLGEADLVVVGGFDTMAKMTVVGFNALRNVSPERCRPFDKNRQGIVLGEGAGVLVLESASHARARGATAMAQFLGYGMSSDAYHMTAPDVTGKGPSRAIEAAIRDAGLAKEEIDYVNAHGTGTIHNDAAETRAIKRVFGEHAPKLIVSSTKSMHGHTLGAAGAIEAVAMIAGMENGFVPPTINYEVPDPVCDLDIVANQAKEGRIRVGLSNNFGFGGNNCSILLGSKGYVQEQDRV